ncbi:uncharacterized protein C6orf47 homolog [Thalassophryne amazonica]|uniref:uncharacterized protein C6orf47 homolog n=1 Tax=Thalassophryne amazonica TaxID=390379 RepID=UPI0014722A4D|nr:uncharacterized protein C6orf47 homolog [Thalassophryne amazonica]
MMAVAGQAWWWLRSWSSSTAGAQNTKTAAGHQHSGIFSSWTSWIWGVPKDLCDPDSPVEEYWEACEKLQQIDTEDMGAEKETVKSRWWNKILLRFYIYFPTKTKSSALQRRKCDPCGDVDGDVSDYGTPPPSPVPSSRLSSPFRLFAHSWNVEILPEHYEICFNFLRHLFDLFVVGFLWTVSPPAKLILEVFGIQGALRLWFHGMAMFFVSTIGMAGLLWLIQEYLPQFALVYGILQALVISVSIRQSVILGVDEENDEGKKDEMKDKKDHKEKLVLPVKETEVKLKF